MFYTRLCNVIAISFLQQKLPEILTVKMQHKRITNCLIKQTKNNQVTDT